MNYVELIKELGIDVVTLSAIIALAVLGLYGVAEIDLIFAIAGLGGYNVYKHKVNSK